jgi:hypothetical protein
LFFLCSDFRCSFWLSLHFFLFAHMLLDVKSLWLGHISLTQIIYMEKFSVLKEDICLWEMHS